jgi:hypothetical protein
VLRSTGDQFRKTACGHGFGRRSHLCDHAFEDAVDQADVAVVEVDL